MVRLNYVLQPKNSNIHFGLKTKIKDLILWMDNNRFVFKKSQNFFRKYFLGEKNTLIGTVAILVSKIHYRKQQLVIPIF